MRFQLRTGALPHYRYQVNLAHIDSQGRILALTCRGTSSTPLKLYPLRSDADVAATEGPSWDIPGAVVEPLGRSWSHLVGIYRQKFTESFTFEIPPRRALRGPRGVDVTVLDR